MSQCVVGFVKSVALTYELIITNGMDAGIVVKLRGVCVHLLAVCTCWVSINITLDIAPPISYLHVLKSCSST